MKDNAALTFWIAGLTVIGLGCWLVMFLAGQDIWHFAGAPDFWRLDTPPYADVRVFAFAFYAQFVVLAVMLVAAAVYFVVYRRRQRQTA